MRRGEEVRDILRLELYWGCEWSSSCSGAAAGPAEVDGRDFGSRPLGSRPPPPGLLLLDGLRRLLRKGYLGRHLLCCCWLNAHMCSHGLLRCLSRFLFFEERGFEGSPRPREGQKFMPFPVNDGAGGCGQGLADGVGLTVLICHEETVLDAIKVGFEVCRAVVWGAERFVVC